jgi:hypothetical protein
MNDAQHELTPAELHYLNDAEIQHHVEAARSAIGTRRLDRHRAKVADALQRVVREEAGVLERLKD